MSPAALRLRAELRHPQRAPGRQDRDRIAPRAASWSRRSSTPAISTLVGRRRRRCRARTADRPQPGARGAGDSGTASAATCVARTPTTVQVIIDGDNANTATTVMGYAQAIVARGLDRVVLRAVTPVGRSRRSLHPRAAGLVQPAASQHAVPGARPHRLHLDDHRRHLHGALHRAREGARNDGAGADGADQPGGVHPRQDAALPRALVRVGAADHPRGHGAVRPADARLVAAALRRRSRCSSSAPRRRAC